MSPLPRSTLGKPALGYSQGVAAPIGTLIFISGQVALDETGNVVSKGSVEKQARYIFEKLQRLLSEAGGSLGDVVKITTFITDMARYSEFAKVRSEAFEAPYPASSAVEVARLVDNDLLVEIEAIAVVPN